MIQLTLIVVFALAFVVGIRTPNRVFHGVLAVAWLAACISWGVAALSHPIIVP